MKKLTIESPIFRRGVDQIITPNELEKKLASGKKMRIKFGSDVTATTLHLGHAVNLWKMRELQEYGHKVIFLIGDFTTKIGDPTGKREVRKKIPAVQIKEWAEHFISQVGTILHTKKEVFEVRKNSEWYDKMKTGDFLDLLSLFTHAKLIERDMFQKRIREHKEIVVSEFLYPILQGYDSVMLESDLAIIGSDQLFNENMGRILQEKFNQTPQVLMTTVITPGIDGGEKMSKSLGNYIGLSDTPRDKFGKIMRIPDNLITPYLLIYTDIDEQVIKEREQFLAKKENPMEAKLFLAEMLVKRYHGEEIAKHEREWFSEVFSQKKVDVKLIPTISLPRKVWNTADLVIVIDNRQSKSTARRLINQGALEIDGKKIKEIKDMEIKKGMVIKLGKKKFVKIG